MLSPQDIQTKEFPKAVFGGYDMTAVDDFLEELEADYTALYKDNAVLKGKLKVLVDKVEEYRSTEDSMRMALMTAQKMSDDMLSETRAKCDEMLKNAENEANAKKNKLDQDLSAEIKRLEIARAETAKFIAASKKLVEDQARFILKIDQMTTELLENTAPVTAVHDEPVRSPEPEPGRDIKTQENTNKAPTVPVQETAPEPIDAVDSIDDDIADTLKEIDSIVADAMVDNGEYSEEEYSSVGNDYDASCETTRPLPDLSKLNLSGSGINKPSREWTQEDEEITPRPKFKFDDLQFGSNYNESK